MAVHTRVMHGHATEKEGTWNRCSVLLFFAYFLGAFDNLLEFAAVPGGTTESDDQLDCVVFFAAGIHNCSCLELWFSAQNSHVNNV